MNKDNAFGAANTETLICVAILIFLAGIGACIFLQQFRYDEEKFDVTVGQTAQSGEAAGEIVFDPPKSFAEMTESETFDAASLSDKINGKADLYLDAGFVTLTAQRFVHSENPALWFEFYLYEMTGPRSAFAVYSNQRRDDSVSVDIAQFCYKTDNALFFTNGEYYVEAVASQPEDVLNEAIAAISVSHIERYPREDLVIPELEFFPTKRLLPDSAIFYPTNAFSFQRLDNIIAMKYDLGSKPIMAFVSVREDAEEASQLVEEYFGFLVDFIGGDRLEPDTKRIPGLKMADLVGDYEMVFSHKNIFAGIHAANDKAVGEEVAMSLYERIREVTK